LEGVPGLAGQRPYLSKTVKGSLAGYSLHQILPADVVEFMILQHGRMTSY
jgi:hypothetical protein